MKGARLPSGVRLVAVGLALAALFAPAVERTGHGRSVVYVVDRSQSMSAADIDEALGFVGAARLAGGRAQVGVVSAGAGADLVLAVGKSPGPRGLEIRRDEDSGTDLAGAVRLAAAALPAGGERRIVVVGDGRGTRGDALEAVARARARGIVVDTVPSGGNGPDGTTVASFELERARVSEGEPVQGEARVRGEPGATVRVGLSRDGSHLRSELVELDETGNATVSVTDSDPGAGAHVYAARVLADPNAPASSEGALHAMAVVTGQPRVLVLTSTGTTPPLVIDALREAEARVRVRNLAEGEPDDELLAETDLVVLADVAVGRDGEESLMPGLSDDGQRRLVDYVREGGGGLLVVGGVFGFGPEYGGAPIARLLPVHIEDRGEQELPRSALAIMLDRSGSMAGMVGRHTKLQLAVEGSLAAASTLRPGDWIGIASVDEATQWVMPVGPVERLADRRGRIRRITAGGGGIFIYTSLADAYGVLRRARMPIRHVIVFSDTADSEEQYLGCAFMPCDATLPWSVDLARWARRRGITTSVVGIGSNHDQDTAFLRQLAAAGGGRFYLTNNGRNLRRIFINETRTATRSNLREGRTPLVASAGHPALEGLDPGVIPPLGGYVETERRPSADTALSTSEGHPVLASWRYGLGMVTAWTSDGGERWTRRWSRWDGAGQLMRQILRHTIRRERGRSADVRVTVDQEALSVRVETAADGDEPPESVELVAVSSSGEERELSTTLERHGPELWVATARTGGAPFVIVRVRGSGGTLLAEAVGRQDDDAELESQGPDARHLAELAQAGGGIVASSPEQTLRGGGPRGSEPVETWPWLLVAAAMLLAVDLWLRRRARPVRGRLQSLFPRGA